MLANVAVDWFLKGGPVMGPILLCLIAALVVVIERALWWWQLRQRCDEVALRNTFDAIATGEFDRAVSLTDSADDPFLLGKRSDGDFNIVNQTHIQATPIIPVVARHATNLLIPAV